MKPFDLEKAKAGHPLITRDGREARFIAYVPECVASSRVFVFIKELGAVLSFYQNGKTFSTAPANTDLFLAPVKRTVKIEWE